MVASCRSPMLSVVHTRPLNSPRTPQSPPVLDHQRPYAAPHKILNNIIQGIKIDQRSK